MNPVLVVIDVQNGFVNDGSRHVVPVVADLAGRWLERGGHVVLTRYLNYAGSPFERLIGWTGLQDADSQRFAPEVAEFAERAHVITKTTYTALTAEWWDLARRYGWTDVVLCGIATDSCVLATAVGAFEAGLVPWVVTDACASSATRTPAADAHAAGLLVIGRMIGEGQLVTAERALGLLPAALARD